MPLAGYADAEKERIAVHHLIPQRLGLHGLSREGLYFSLMALRRLKNRACASSAIVSTRSAVERYGCGPRVSSCPGRSDRRPVAAWLGAPPFRDEVPANRTDRPGVAVGLAATPKGGGLVGVEVSRLPGRGSLRVTGTVGAMMKKSVAVALTWHHRRADAAGDGRARRRHPPKSCWRRAAQGWRR